MNRIFLETERKRVSQTSLLSYRNDQDSVPKPVIRHTSYHFQSAISIVIKVLDLGSKSLPPV